jgi:hypothetical protein
MCWRYSLVHYREMPAGPELGAHQSSYPVIVRFSDYDLLSGYLPIRSLRPDIPVRISRPSSDPLSPIPCNILTFPRFLDSHLIVTFWAWT